MSSTIPRPICPPSHLLRIIFGAFGWAFFNNILLTLLLAFVLFLFFDVKSRREESWLCEKYPDYAAYQARVHKLIPFIY